ncbi:MAG: neutral/alkaline non-lysosomal ceramidase N-terminal domain-containing protein [Aureliella sp.]
MRHLAFFAIHLAAALVLSSPSLAAEPLRVGVAEADITPPEGFPIAGYYHERLAEGTIDPLKAKAIVFAQGDTSAAVVVCDLTAVSRDLCEVVRKRASEKTGIPPEAIAVSGTHSHTAPDYSKHLYQYLSRLKSGEATDADGPAPYAEKLIGGIVEAIVKAHERLEPASLASGSAPQEVPVSFNRRFVMKDGSTQTWRSLSDPNVVRAAGPIDSEVGVVVIKSDSGKLQGVFSNFALHLDTVGGMRWSADYPYFIEQGLRDRYGKEVVSIFGTGCCGDINHVDPTKKERNKTEYIGRAIATTVESAIPATTNLKRNDLQVRSTVVELPLKDVSDEQLKRSRELLKVIRNGGKVEFLDQVAAYKTLMLSQFRDSTRQAHPDQEISWGLTNTWAGVGDALPVDVQTITIGDELALVFLPGEIFVDLGLAIKRASPYRSTFVVELSNGVETGYVPTRAACAGGGYEVTNTTLKPGGGEMLVEAAIGLLRESASSR